MTEILLKSMLNPKERSKCQKVFRICLKYHVMYVDVVCPYIYLKREPQGIVG